VKCDLNALDSRLRNPIFSCLLSTITATLLFWDIPPSASLEVSTTVATSEILSNVSHPIPQMENEKKTDSREWELDAETEYRFELDPGTSLAIKVR
jgi:hypothetical protein